MKIISIEPYDDLEMAKSKIKREVGTLNLRPLSPPLSLMGSHKILQLYSNSFDNIIKIDGPSIIIDKLYEYFL